MFQGTRKFSIDVAPTAFTKRTKIIHGLTCVHNRKRNICTMTVALKIFEHDLSWFTVNQRAKCQGQRQLSSTVIVRTHGHTHTEHIARPGPLNGSVIKHNLHVFVHFKCSNYSYCCPFKTLNLRCSFRTC